MTDLELSLVGKKILRVVDSDGCGISLEIEDVGIVDFTSSEQFYLYLRPKEDGS